MRVQQIYCVGLLLLGNLCNPLCTTASTVADPRLIKYVTDAREQILKNWEPLKFEENAKAVIQFKIYATGRIADVKMTQSTGDPQADSSCLDAVEELDPFSLMETYHLNENELTTFITFEHPDSSRAHHCDKYSKNGLLVFHSVPLEVLTRYPNEFNESELHAPQNLRLYDPKHARSYWSIQLDWANWFRANPKASRKEIIAERDMLVNTKFQGIKPGEGP
jgi:TonB family protein